MKRILCLMIAVCLLFPAAVPAGTVKVQASMAQASDTEPRKDDADAQKEADSSQKEDAAAQKEDDSAQKENTDAQKEADSSQKDDAAAQKEETAGEKDDAAAQKENTAEETETEEVFAQWKEDAPSLQALTDYVEAVTDKNSGDFIPEEDRIAVFDMDGTLMGELYPTYLEYYMLAWRILKDPSFTADEELLNVGRTLRDCALDNSFPEDMAMQHAKAAAKAYAGMTLNEFSDFVTEILLRDVDGFEGMNYGESFYLPMVEVVEYLQDNGFKCYVCSGSDRFICRTFIEGMLDIPYENIIGMDVELEATGQGEADGLDYVYTTEDDVVRTDRLLIKNLKTNKVLQIAQEIGRQPVLSFGNSSGDVSMHNYTISNKKYRSAAFMLVADDDVRDYGSPEKGAELKEKWEKSGYSVISMANDWKTIYGDKVVKTGKFRWAEELATQDEAPDPKIFVTINTEGQGNIDFAEGDKAPEIDRDYPMQSGQINLAEPAAYTLLAWPNAGNLFVKWTKNGSDYSTEPQIKVLLDESADYVAVFKDDPDWQNPVMNFVGEYQCDRAHAKVECLGKEDALIKIEWAGSAAEVAEWIITGRLDPETQTISYEGCGKSHITYNADGEVVSQEQEYENGTGTIVFGKDGTFTWHEDQSKTGEDLVFQWLPVQE